LSVFIFRRFLTLIATLVGASLIIFLVLDALPGNAAQMLMGADASPDAVRALAAKLGLDQPLHYRYVHWIAGLLTGDLGNSYAYGTPVAALIAERLTLTIPLAIMSMSMTVVLALSAGIYTAANHNKLGDVGVMSLTQFGIALPNFWFAILLILLFSVKLQWLSAGGFAGWNEGIIAGIKSLLLHAFSCRCRRVADMGRRRWITLRRCAVVADHPDGTCGQALDRGLRPRLSIGTLQLSSRCSSIHFLPRRSFPVSDGPLAGTAVSAFGAVWSGCLSCAKTPDAKHTAKRKLINPR